MASRVLSVVLGTESAKLSEISHSGNKVHVYNAYDIQISEGLCDDGVILDVEGLAYELKQYISNFGIKTKKLLFSISTKRIASKEVMIPFVKEKQIEGLLKANAQDYFPIQNIESYTLSHSIIETVQGEDTKQYRLSVIATPNDLLANYYELAKQMKMSVETIDYAGNAILQILKLQATSDVTAILQLGRESTVINIMNGKTLIMQRSISYGLDAILSAIMDTVHMDVEDAQAFVEDNDIARIAQAYSDVAEVLSLITNGIGRIFDFYSQRNSQNPITAVFFLGDGTLINGIGDTFEREFGFPTEEIMALKNVVVKNRSMNNNDPTNFLANVGSIIAPMNLKYVSQEEVEKQEKTDSKPAYWLIVLSVIASAALAAGSIFAYKSTESEKQELEQKLASLQSMQALEDQLNEAKSKNQIVQDFLASTKGPNDSLLQLITDLEKIIPAGASIDSLDITDGRVTLNMGAHGKESVAKLIYELKNLKYVRNVHIDYVSETFKEIDAYDAFTITFDLLDVNAINEAESEQEEVAVVDDALTPETGEDITGGEE